MIEQHVVSLDEAKKLKEYLPEDRKFKIGDWCYEDCDMGRLMLITGVNEYSVQVIFPFTQHPNNDVKMLHSIIPAPLLGEMLELLPEYIYKGEIIYLRVQLDGCIEYRSLMHHHVLKGSSFYNKSRLNIGTDVNRATGAAQLFMMLVDNGHVAKDGV